MSTLVYISRNFTEFGAFTVAEILDFKKRGIVLDGDFIREDGSDAWTPSLDFLGSLPEPAPKATPKPKAVKVATPAKESKPATKAPAKKAAKKASTPAE